ncbi:hypothetical protein I79_024374 [Cricetulus griseus]|uniref:Uncharacterized protein n=1 Tax=Cricetulus griseus TaxID=10029 RepID=G3IKH1_CRIGR|nr:hypothetical protein I79_024374 [Cricetulus griseus]
MPHPPTPQSWMLVSLDCRRNSVPFPTGLHGFLLLAVKEPPFEQGSLANALRSLKVRK